MYVYVYTYTYKDCIKLNPNCDDRVISNGICPRCTPPPLKQCCETMYYVGENCTKRFPIYGNSKRERMAGGFNGVHICI